MNLDKYQQAWQQHTSETRVTVDADVLHKLVQRSQHDFLATIRGRDTVEIAVGLLLLPYWIYQGLSGVQPWTWWLGVPAILWVIGFFLVDRWRHPQRPSPPGEPLVSCAKNSLTQVEHQIWLLRNVFWWYLLPFTISLLAYFGHVSLITAIKTGNWLGGFVFGAGLYLFVGALYYFIYYINQRAVRTQLEPRREELLKLLASFSDDASGEVHGDFPILMRNQGTTRAVTPRRRLVAGLLAALLALSALVVIGFLMNRDPSPAELEKSPFAAVRWDQSQPEVKIGDEWFKLVSLDGTPAADIVAFSKNTHGSRWRKRFEEDLVALLTEMGHPPKDTVQLVVKPLKSGEPQTLDDVPMTKANRRAIRNAASERDRLERKQPTRSSDHTKDADAPLTKLVVKLRKEKDLVGLAALVMVDGKVVASAADGERKKGSGVWLDVGDQWHIGGASKSVTATMIARLVEAGEMKWSDTIGAAFPGAPIHDDWKQVTLKQLLTDTAGTPANFPDAIRFQLPKYGPESTEARREAVLYVMKTKPDYPAGTKHVYSSVGYTIATAMAEKVTGTTWEELIKREVFEPLKLTGAGFGPPKSSDETIEQPRGHRSYHSGKYVAADDADNTAIIGPAATLRMTLDDLCTFATEHMRGESGNGKLLSADTYKLLHTPELNNYAFGWGVKQPGEKISHRLYWHNGANTMWYALVVFIPDEKMVVAVTSNDGDLKNAEAAAWEVVKASAAGRVTEVAEQMPEKPEP